MTPYVLTASSAQEVLHGAGTPTPSASDFTGTFYCGHAGGTLYLAGRITDTQIVTPTGNLALGDAVEITLDMLADGFAQPLVDDHSLTLAPSGRLRNFGVYPVVAEVQTTVGTGYWIFEIGIPASQHGRADLTSADYSGLAYAYYARLAGAAIWDNRITGYKLRATMQ